MRLSKHHGSAPPAILAGLPFGGAHPATSASKVTAATQTMDDGAYGNVPSSFASSVDSTILATAVSTMAVSSESVLPVRMAVSVPGSRLVDADNGAAHATTVTETALAPEALPLEPLEVPLGDNMDLAVIRVKIQRLSDELAGALVSLEELVRVPTAVVRDADVQTEMVLGADHGGNGTREGVSMALQTPLTNVDITQILANLDSARARAGRLDAYVLAIQTIQSHMGLLRQYLYGDALGENEIDRIRDNILLIDWALLDLHGGVAQR